MRRFPFVSVVIAIALLAGAQSSNGQSEKVPDSPAAIKHPLIPSHGSNLLGVVYLAAGSQPHPTAILFHGFPGFEQNLDLAQALRRSGWNVLAYHYRGSWGVGGTFSFLHCIEDADAEVGFALDLKTAERYHIDPHHVVVIGHSMGGLVAAAAAAHNPQIEAVVLLSAWNIGAPRPSEVDEAKALSSAENLVPITGATGTTLAREEFLHRADLDLLTFARVMKFRPVMVVTANDGSDQFATPFVAALRAAGDSRISSVHFATDHVYSGQRLELIENVLAFLKNLPS